VREKASWRHGCNRVTRGVEITLTIGRGKGKLPSTGDGYRQRLAEFVMIATFRFSKGLIAKDSVMFLFFHDSVGHCIIAPSCILEGCK
jgi:hypothetical protein